MNQPQHTHSLDYGHYIVLHGQQVRLTKHPTDFTVLGQTEATRSIRCQQAVPLSAHMTRLTASSPEDTDQLMAEARQDSIAHHIYQVEGTDEEIIIDDRILLTLRHEGTSALDEIIQTYQLVSEGRMGKAHILRVTEATGRNPLKVANEIAQRDDVIACHPQVMLEQQRH